MLAASGSPPPVSEPNSDSKDSLGTLCDSRFMKGRPTPARRMGHETLEHIVFLGYGQRFKKIFLVYVRWRNC